MVVAAAEVVKVVVAAAEVAADQPGATAATGTTGVSAQL
jgi:hypothetical protein